MRFTSNKDDNVWNFIAVTSLFAKLTCTVYLKHSIHLNVPRHWFSIGFNAFILVITASIRDVIAINMLMNSFVLMYKWSIPPSSSLSYEFTIVWLVPIITPVGLTQATIRHSRKLMQQEAIEMCYICNIKSIIIRVNGSCNIHSWAL